MGSSFRRQIDPVQHEQNCWVPRSPDQNGGGIQGMRLVGLVYGVDELFSALAIRDSLAHASTPPADQTNQNPEGANFDQVHAPYKTALVVSTLDQSVSLQPTWSVDGVNFYAFGSTVAVNAGASAVIPLSTPSQYVPYVGLVATCATPPSTGSLTASLARLG